MQTLEGRSLQYTILLDGEEREFSWSEGLCHLALYDACVGVMSLIEHPTTPLKRRHPT